MAKKKPEPRSKTKPASPAKRKRWSSNRGRTVPANGSVEQPNSVAPEPKVPIGEAMRLAVEALGDLAVDTSLAPQQLRELGEVVEEITRRQAAYDAKAEEAKTAKKSLESAQELLVEKTRSFTHPAPMPLFDATAREDDHAEMLAAGDVQELGVDQVTV